MKLDEMDTRKVPKKEMERYFKPKLGVLHYVDDSEHGDIPFVRFPYSGDNNKLSDNDLFVRLDIYLNNMLPDDVIKFLKSEGTEIES